MIPTQVLPGVARRISILLPATHAMNAFNSLAMGQEETLPPTISVIALLSGSLLAFCLAVTLFNWDDQNDTRRGHPVLGILVFLPYAAAILLLS